MVATENLETDDIIFREGTVLCDGKLTAREDALRASLVQNLTVWFPSVGMLQDGLVQRDLRQ